MNLMQNVVKSVCSYTCSTQPNYLVLHFPVFHFQRTHFAVYTVSQKRPTLLFPVTLGYYACTNAHKICQVKRTTQKAHSHSQVLVCLAPNYLILLTFPLSHMHTPGVCFCKLWVVQKCLCV